MYYDVNKTLSHNAFVNLVIGIRGYGKTFGLKKKAITNFLTKGEEFIYLRRYDSELKLVKDNLFNDINMSDYFNENEKVIFKEDKYFIGGEDDNELCGYAMSLSRSSYYKSSSFPKVSLIIFDEFIIDTSNTTRYLTNEIEKFLNFLETIFRMRDNCKCFLLANSISFVNPYTIYWDLKLGSKGYAKTKDNLVLCEIVGDNEFIEAKQKTRFGMLNKNSDFEKFSLFNSFYMDKTEFIEKKTGKCRHIFSFTNNNKMYGVWQEKETQKVFISNDVDKTCKICYSTTNKDHTPNTLLLKRTSRSLFSLVFDSYRQGMLRFETQKIQGMFDTLLKNYF